MSEVLTELVGGRMIVGPPKSEAGRRTVAIPPHLVPEVESHLAAYVKTDCEYEIHRFREWVSKAGVGG